MPIKKGTPGKGGGSRTDSFSYTPVQFGLKNSFGGFLAGDVYWAEEAHEHKEHDPGTKPCLHWISDGALLCKRCRRGAKATCIGWVPLYRAEDHSPIIVIIHENVMDLVSTLKYRDYCIIGRVTPKSSVFVKRSDTPQTFKTENEKRKRPVDITRDLLTMWQIPELNEFIARQELAVQEASTMEGVLDRIAVDTHGDPYDVAMQAAMKRTDVRVVTPEDADYEKVKAKFLARTPGLKMVSRNGKHTE